MTRLLVLLLTVTLSGPAAALTRPERRAVRRCAQACREACREAVLFPTTTTTTTTETTTMTYPPTTSTTTTTTQPWVTMQATPCGVLRLRGAHDGPFTMSFEFEGELECPAGTDTFQGYWPAAPPPTDDPIRGGCSGAFATLVNAPYFALTLTCPVCCPQGMAVTPMVGP